MGLVLGPPKSRAGTRTVSLPDAVLPAIGQDLDEFVDAEPEAFVFTGPTGAPIWRGNLNKVVTWRETIAALGVPGLHFHDLRHTGNTVAGTGASLRDLMARMGHDSAGAAMVYQHATSAADRAIAEAVDRAVRATNDQVDDAPDDGAAGALVYDLMAR